MEEKQKEEIKDEIDEDMEETFERKEEEELEREEEELEREEKEELEREEKEELKREEEEGLEEQEDKEEEERREDWGVVVFPTHVLTKPGFFNLIKISTLNIIFSFFSFPFPLLPKTRLIPFLVIELIMMLLLVIPAIIGHLYVT